LRKTAFWPLMNPLDLIWHALNFVAPALGVGFIGAALSRLLWRKELKHRAWWRLAAWPSAAGIAVLVGGLLAFGRDGRMATYALMVLATALALGWGAFVARR
jgi:hypothetical protein